MQERRHTLLTKLRPPRLGPDVLERPRLLARLDDGLSKPLTLLGAPAGYGKTTLLAQWIQHQDRPVAWLTLDEGDNEVDVLVEEIVAAVRTKFPDSCTRVMALLARPGLPPVKLLNQELANGLDELDEFVLVLDDVHSVNNPDVLEILKTLIWQAPKSLHLVLASRADPVLPLGALRGRGLMNEIRAADLCFSHEEAAEYLRGAFGPALTEEELTALLQRTEGWIAGLHLAALSLAGRENIEQGIAEFTGNNRYVVEYLMDELWARLDPKVERYLLATSILDRLCAPLCRAVVGEEDLDSVQGQPVLEWLEDANLFTVSLDDQREWFRYHHLFRDVLRRSLNSTWSPEDIAALHTRAAQWLSDRGMVDDALMHFLTADRPESAADVVEMHGKAAIEHEEWRALERWMGTIEAGLLDSRPRLVLFQAWLAHIRQDLVGTIRHCERAEQLLGLQQPPLQDELALRAVISALRAEVCFWTGMGDEGLFHAREALAHLPPDYELARATAAWFEGGSLHLLGRNDEAFEVFRRYSFGDYGSVHPRVMVGLCLMGFMTGEVDYAQRSADLMLKESLKQGLMESAGWAHYFLGLAAYLRNDLALAEEHYAGVEPYAAHIVAVKQCYYGLAWVRRAQGRSDKAVEVLDKFRSIAADLDVTLLAETQLLEARLEVLSGRPSPQEVLARGVLQAAGDGPISSLHVTYEFSLISTISVLTLRGSEDDAEACHGVLQRLLTTAELNGNVYRLVECLLLQSLLFDRQGRNAEALDSLARAVKLARPGRMIRLFPDMGGRMRALLQTVRIRSGTDSFLDELMASFTTGAPSSSAGHTPPSQDQPQEYLIETLLTNRELEVLMLLAERLSNKEIARRLVISPATVKRHTLSIYSKLDVAGRREAVARARELGILPVSQ